MKAWWPLRWGAGFCLAIGVYEVARFATDPVGWATMLRGAAGAYCLIVAVDLTIDAAVRRMTDERVQ